MTPELLECLECGRFFRALGSHLKVHGLNQRGYVIKHKLPLGFRMMASDIRDSLRRQILGSPERMARIIAQAPKACASYTASSAAKNSETRKSRIPMTERVAHAGRMAAGMSRWNVEQGRTVDRCCTRCGKLYTEQRTNKIMFCGDPCRIADLIERNRAKGHA